MLVTVVCIHTGLRKKTMVAYRKWWNKTDTPWDGTSCHYVSQSRGLLMCFIKVIRKVRKRRHRIPLFGHIVDEISKNREKKGTTGFNGA